MGFCTKTAPEIGEVLGRGAFPNPRQGWALRGGTFSPVRESTQREHLEPVFTAEDAGWARDFSARQGAFSQECFVHFKKTQRSMAEKDPSTRRLRL